MVKQSTLTPEQADQSISKNKTNGVDAFPTPTEKETATHELRITAETMNGNQSVRGGTQNNLEEVEYTLERVVGHEKRTKV